MSFASLPIINLDLFLTETHESQAVVAECKKAADALVMYGALLVQDSRVSEDDNDTFLDLVEDYFSQSEEILRKDERSELGYQVGVTLENTEKPKCAVDEPCLQIIARLEPSERPLDITAHQPDPKCRFFWKMGDVPPYETRYPALNAPNVVPEDVSIKNRWVPTMEKWGSSMKNACAHVFINLILGVSTTMPHLLAPTASDLKKYGQKDTILAGFHSDLNFLTIHGRSRYPGLHIWARNTGKRIPVVFPPTGRYLLVQAGKQFEHLSGGLVKAGFHEVVVSDNTLKTIERRKQTHRDRPLILPIPSLAERAKALKADTNNLGNEVEEETLYEPMKVGQQVQNELRHIALMA
ncbi:Clavaminate synthase-like protein [Phellopilus nigrolimitatus]|nr:Clavaminate synthase-like protein [Phellopilus nigrolimitatus]